MTAFTSADLYRALQHHKTDDLEAIRRVVDDQLGTVGNSGNGYRPHLVDLCSGIGRTVSLYRPGSWRVTCVDTDRTALLKIGRRRPDVNLRCAPVTDGLVLDPADAIICAHNSANEVGDVGLVIDIASRSLSAGGVFYLDLLVGDRVYPRAYLREAVRSLWIGGEQWVLNTAILPGASPSSHILLLFGHTTKDDGGFNRRMMHHIPRVVPTSDAVLERAAQRNLRLVRREGTGRFVFSQVGGARPGSRHK